MNRGIRWVLGSIIVLALLWLLPTPPVVANVVTPGHVMIAMAEIKQVAIAACSYADEHHGRLPSSLSDLLPSCLPNDRYLKGTHLTTPEAVLADLPKETIMLFRVAFSAEGGQPFLIIAHPDGSIEQKRLMVHPARRSSE